MTWAVASERIDRTGVLGTPLEAAEEPYAIIPLHGKYGHGKVAKVSLCDAARVRRHKWYVNKDGYVFAYDRYTPKKFRPLLMHRFILDAPDGVLVDHRYGDTLDNRRSKIRLATHADNSRNRRTRKENRVSRFIGVHRSNSSTWQAAIVIDSKGFYIASYEIEEEAAKAYDACARHYFGEFAVCNFEGTEALSIEEVRALASAATKARFMARKTSQYMGVSFATGESKWKARIRVGTEVHLLGTYKDEVETALAYDAVARHFFCDKARTNFPEGETLSPHDLRRRNLLAAFKRGETTSRYEGVHLDKGGRWFATINIGGRRRHIASFLEELHAAKAFDSCVRHYLPHGSFTNFEGLDAVSIESYKRKKPRGGTSQFRGVSWCQKRERWVSQLTLNGKKILGRVYQIEEDATRAYDDARVSY